MLGVRRFFGDLSTVPESDDPHGLFSNSVKESVGHDIKLAVRKLGKLEDDRAQLGESRESLECFARL